MKKNRFLLSFLLSLMTVSFFISSTFAAGQYFFEKTDFTNLTIGDSFKSLLVVDTGGAEVVKMKMVFKYDPTFLDLDVDNVFINQDIPCDFPDADNYVDTANGYLYFTADCSANPYISSNTASGGVGDYILQLGFIALKSGNTSVEWVYTGIDDGDSTVMMENQSPPQNILTAAPQPISVSITSDNTNTVTNPDTGIIDENPYIVALIIGFLGIIVGIGVYNNQIKKSDTSTLVLINDENY